MFSLFKKKNYFNDLEKYIKENKEEVRFGSFKKMSIMCEYASLASEESIENYIQDNNTNNTFQEVLFKMIDDRNLKDSDVYNKVHIDRRLFSKIRNDNLYHPSKETVILLGLSLELSEDEVEKLLDSASYSLPKNNNYDLIIRYCFNRGIYKIKDINELLNHYELKEFNY